MAKSNNSGPTIFTQLGKALLGLFKLIFSKKDKKFNHEQLLAQFGTIEKLVESNDPIHAAQAVVRADSFLDLVMKKSGARGETFGERLKNIESRFERSFYQQLWEAHKLRNRIAHEHPEVSIAQAKNSLETFRRAASILGAF
ncbi:hypothetical protein KC644_00160 [Candidatus Berkelbacteria bacterium]|nr:hypothetical protein [Candidatus Berkelbacteria bacterium]